MHKDMVKVLFTALFSLLAIMAIISIIPFPIAYNLAESMESIVSASGAAQQSLLAPWTSTTDLTIRLAGTVITAVASLLAVLFVVMGRVKLFRIAASTSLITYLAVDYNIIWGSIIALDPFYGTMNLLYIATAATFALSLAGKIRV